MGNLTSDDVVRTVPGDDTLRRIRFKTEPLRSLFADEEPSLIIVIGAITTHGRFARFDESLCHLCGDGTIMRYGRVIGSADDIEYLDEATP